MFLGVGIYCGHRTHKSGRLLFRDKTMKTKTTTGEKYVERYKQDFPYGNLIQLQKLFNEAMQEAYDDGYEDGASMNPRKS